MVAFIYWNWDVLFITWMRWVVPFKNSILTIKWFDNCLIIKFLQFHDKPQTYIEGCDFCFIINFIINFICVYKKLDLDVSGEKSCEVMISVIVSCGTSTCASKGCLVANLSQLIGAIITSSRSGLDKFVIITKLLQISSNIYTVYISIIYYY